MDSTTPATSGPAGEPERIGAYEVHPAASLFSLLEGDDFEALCESIRKLGLLHPIVVHEGTLLDGRNRLRAVLDLHRQGFTEVKLSVVEWRPTRNELPAEFVYDTNSKRRHMTDNALALMSSEIVPLIAAERAAAQAQTQFKPGNKAAKKTAETKTSPPSKKRDTKEKDASSTVGKVAKAAKVSMHKARQAVAVTKAAAAGKVSKADVKAVVAGKKKLRDVLPKPKKRPAKAKIGICHDGKPHELNEDRGVCGKCSEPAESIHLDYDSPIDDQSIGVKAVAKAKAAQTHEPQAKPDRDDRASFTTSAKPPEAPAGSLLHAIEKAIAQADELATAAPQHCATLLKQIVRQLQAAHDFAGSLTAEWNKPPIVVPEVAHVEAATP